MSLTIHPAGIDASKNAAATGFSGEIIQWVDLFDGSTKIKRLELKGVQVIEPARIYVVAQDATDGESYDVTRMDFITDGDVLFATVEHDDGSVIQSKGENATFLLTHQLNISAAPGSVAPSGDVSIYMPHATEELLGGAEIASQTEANSNTDDTRFLTAKKLYNRTATESRRGVAEVATQSETDAGSDDSRMVTPKKLWALLTAKFARTDIRPVFKEGLSSNNKPWVFNGTGTNVDHVWYDDTDNEFHFVADSEELSTGNANIKLGGIQLGSGARVTGVSDSATSTSTTTLATSKAVDTARDDGTRQATESQRGQAEIATQTEANNKSEDSRFLTPKKLWAILSNFVTRSEARVVGEICYFSLETPPPGFFALDGSTVPNGVIDYPDLAASGSKFITISGNNIVLLNIDDFIRGKGNSSRSVGQYNSDTYKSHSHGITALARTTGGSGGSQYTIGYDPGGVGDNQNIITGTYSSGSSETAPRHYTALICIYHGEV